MGTCTVLNLGGNKYRIVARVFYTSHKVYVLPVMTHAEYDGDDWPTQCGCHQPPPNVASGAGADNRSTVSDLVSGKRPFTVKQMHAVASVFGLPGTVFLPKIASQ